MICCIRTTVTLLPALLAVLKPAALYRIGCAALRRSTHFSKRGAIGSRHNMAVTILGLPLLRPCTSISIHSTSDSTDADALAALLDMIADTDAGPRYAGPSSWRAMPPRFHACERRCASCRGGAGSNLQSFVPKDQNQEASDHDNASFSFTTPLGS